MQSRRSFPRILTFLYTHNPFYLLSACLILYGVHLAFRPAAGELVNPWGLMAALCSYTAVAAATAFLIVRLGKVWEDARSLILVLLFLFLAISISFDEIVNTDPASGRLLLLCGFAFSALITEGLLRGLRISLPALFRGPYYGILALFFFYPLVVSPEITGLSVSDLEWRIALFPTVAGLLFLTLFPAVRRGSGYVRENGTPWRWPWFPWTAFVFLGIAVCVRSYVLSLSFLPAGGMETPFGLYFLIPFLFAVLVLLLETGLVERRPGLSKFVMLTAPLLLLLGIPTGGSTTYGSFLSQVVERAASPLFLTLCGLFAFYGYAWIRGTPFAAAGFTLSLLGATVVGPQTLAVDSLTQPDFRIVGLAGLVFLGQAGLYRSSWRAFCGAACLAIVAPHGLPEPPIIHFRALATYHLILASMLVIGALGRDRFATFLRKLAALLLPLTCLAVLVVRDVPAFEEWMRFVYASGLTVLSFGYWHWTGDRWHLYAVSANLAFCGAGGLWTLHGRLRTWVGSPGYGPLAWGAACFLLGVLISAVKAGAGRRLFDRDIHAPPEVPSQGD